MASCPHDSGSDCDDRAERFAIVFWKGLVKLSIFLVLLYALLSPCLHWRETRNHRIVIIEKHTMASLARGLSEFHAEYAPLRTKEDLTAITDATFIRPLMALDQNLNPLRIKFVDLPEVKQDHPGLSGHPPILVDQWGQPYHIILDTNNDNQIINPEFAAADPVWKLKVHATETLKPVSPSTPPARIAIQRRGKTTSPVGGGENSTPRSKR